MENSDELEQSTQSINGNVRCGRCVGAIGAIFNTIGATLFFAYGASTLSVLFNIIFWMFVITLVTCIVWQIGVVYERPLLLVPALICWIIQFFYCLCWTFVWFLIKLFISSTIVGGLLTIIFTFVGGFCAIVVSVIYFYYAVNVFFEMLSTNKKSSMDVTYTPASIDADIC